MPTKPDSVSRAAAAAAAGARGNSGIEGQRSADRRGGRYLNPIVSGDHADPTILKDGDDYYMTFSSFLSYPGAVIWHSRDLVHWAPIAAALHEPIGSVWAMDLCKHGDRYYLYVPVLGDKGTDIFVTWADDIRGPWSKPQDLGLTGCIDPGHIVGEDGRRYLFVNGIRRVRLRDDGLATEGALEAAYSPWQYPKDWVVETFAPEGPKLLRREGWFYLVTAVGGTAGPPTSHMVIAARSRSVHGPWEHCPHNPLVRTRSAAEPWWSRGHATLVEGPRGDWWMVYHGYENGFRTLGRQTLLEPVEWMADGWFRATGGDLSRPLLKPAGGQRGPSGMALSDDFQRPRWGLQWSFQGGGRDEQARARFGPDGLLLAGAGCSPADSPPMVFNAGDRAYEITVELQLDAGAVGGLLLYYSERMYVGLGFTPNGMQTYQYGQEQTWLHAPLDARRVFVRLRNDCQVLTWWHSTDGCEWTQHPLQMEVSGMHHNVFGGFLSLRPAVFSAGTAPLRVRRLDYRGLAG